MQRRTLLLGASAGFALTGLTAPAALAQRWDPQLTDFDRTRGDPEAPNTIIEYASFTCGHCANFHNTKMAEVQERLIDTGRVFWVFRDFPLDGLALRAGMLARCAPENQFFPIVGQLFATQNQWARAADPIAALARIGQMAGMSRESFEACMVDEELANRIIELRVGGEDRYSVSATPTFVVNGRVVSGDVPVATLEQHLT